jgi:hypothetical protein
MIKTEEIIINGKLFVRTYSDSGYLVERDGVCYSEAIDPVEFERTYTETDKLMCELYELSIKEVENL